MRQKQASGVIKLRYDIMFDLGQENNGMGEESPKKVVNCDFWVGENYVLP